jgi:hypothetical protein
MAWAGGVGGRRAPLETEDRSAAPVDGVLTLVLPVGVPSPWLEPTVNRSIGLSSIETVVTLCTSGTPGFVPVTVLGVAGGLEEVGVGVLFFFFLVLLAADLTVCHAPFAARWREEADVMDRSSRDTLASWDAIVLKCR